MRLAIGIIIGLASGLAVGATGMTYWKDRYGPALQEADRAPPSPAQHESYVLCKMNFDNAPFNHPMVIKGDRAGARQIVMPWTTDGDLFLIEQTTDLHYLATNTEAKCREVSSDSLDFNRLTGELNVTSRFSPAAIQLLTSICQRRAPRDECAAGMKQLGGSGGSNSSLSGIYGHRLSH
jgi:hypothetical protein